VSTSISIEIHARKGDAFTGDVVARELPGERYARVSLGLGGAGITVYPHKKNVRALAALLSRVGAELAALVEAEEVEAEVEAAPLALRD
jgi:hypothetical protein